jgi:hypothetical protein
VSRLGLVLAFALLAGTVVLPSAQVAAAVAPQADPFYAYAGVTPLAHIAAGTVLKTRILAYHVLGLSLPVEAVQLLYRTTGMLGQPTVNVTSVLEPPVRLGTPNVVSYQSFYDSLSPSDEPSYAISGGLTLGGLIPTAESVLIMPALLAGSAVVVPDTEGENADFAAGPEYGMNTLDSLRAAIALPFTGLAGTTKIGMLGYSGGAIATEWAAELAPAYAPDVNRRLVGASFGGVLVDPAHNLSYISGSLLWSGVLPMALIGIGRSFHVDLIPYLNAYGLALDDKLQSASIIDVLGAYPGLTYPGLVQPQYANPDSVPFYVSAANQLIMGTRGTPTEPLLIDQGANGTLDGTSANTPGIGPGDGVMVTGDVRTLAREYCARGVTVQYNEYELLDHLGTAASSSITSVRPPRGSLTLQVGSPRVSQANPPLRTARGSLQGIGSRLSAAARPRHKGSRPAARGLPPAAAVSYLTPGDVSAVVRGEGPEAPVRTPAAMATRLVTGWGECRRSD